MKKEKDTRQKNLQWKIDSLILTKNGELEKFLDELLIFEIMGWYVNRGVYPDVWVTKTAKYD